MVQTLCSESQLVWKSESECHERTLPKSPTIIFIANNQKQIKRLDTLRNLKGRIGMFKGLQAPDARCQKVDEIPLASLYTTQ